MIISRRGGAGLAITLALGVALATSSASLAQAPVVITQPDWKAVPSADQMLLALPAAAAAQGVDGQATITCTVTIHGALTRCSVESESPAGLGFGAAALALTPQFLMTPATRNGVPVEGVARFPIRWKGFTPRQADTRPVLSPTSAWAEAPTWDDVVAAYPAKARAAGKGGRSTIFCDFRKDGRLTVCRWLSVDTPGYDFEKAALALAKKFRLENPRAGRASVQLTFAFDPAMLAPGPHLVRYPDWLTTPAATEIRTAFAGLAPAQARLRCRVAAGGGLDSCATVAERPAGAGARALSLAPKYRLSGWSSAGLPTVGAEVEIVVDGATEPAR